MKPANVKLRPDGMVKVLDFGLAKALGPVSGVGADVTALPTITSPAMTRMDVILGTPAYMSREQAKGRAADKPCDIWAFGCVLFETLTGTSAFAGETLTDVVAAVMKNEPDWHALPADTPPAIRSLLRRCLKKGPVVRLHDIADARIEIQEAIAEPAAMSQTAPQRGAAGQWPRAIPWAVAGLLAVAVPFLTMQPGPRRTVSSGASVTRLDLNLPAGVELATVYAPAAVLSPDGTRVAFLDVLSGLRQLYARRLNQFETVPLRGTENANTIFFSPDGRALGFITPDLSLKKESNSRSRRPSDVSVPPPDVGRPTDRRGSGWRSVDPGHHARRSRMTSAPTASGC